jgi:hypothetical protein
MKKIISRLCQIISKEKISEAENTRKTNLENLTQKILIWKKTKCRKEKSRKHQYVFDHTKDGVNTTIVITKPSTQYLYMKCLFQIYSKFI